MKHIIRILALLLALVLSVSLMACSQQNPDVPDGFLLAENEGADYYFYYPSSWLLDRCDAGMTSAYVSETDFSNVSVTVFTASAEYSSLPDYAKGYYFPQFEDNFQNLTLEYNQDGSLKRSSLKIDQCDAIAVNFSAVFAGESYSFRAWFLYCNGYIYTVLYTAKSAVFESHLEVAGQIAENLQIK